MKGSAIGETNERAHTLTTAIDIQRFYAQHPGVGSKRNSLAQALEACITQIERAADAGCFSIAYGSLEVSIEMRRIENRKLTCVNVDIQENRVLNVSAMGMRQRETSV